MYVYIYIYIYVYVYMYVCIYIYIYIYTYICRDLQPVVHAPELTTIINKTCTGLQAVNVHITNIK